MLILVKKSFITFTKKALGPVTPPNGFQEYVWVFCLQACLYVGSPETGVTLHLFVAHVCVGN